MKDERILTDTEFKKIVTRILEKLEEIEISGQKLIVNYNKHMNTITFNESIPKNMYMDNASKKYSDFVNDFVISGISAEINYLYSDRDIQKIPSLSYSEKETTVTVSILNW